MQTKSSSSQDTVTDSVNLSVEEGLKEDKLEQKAGEENSSNVRNEEMVSKDEEKSSTNGTPDVPNDVLESVCQESEECGTENFIEINKAENGVGESCLPELHQDESCPPEPHQDEIDLPELHKDEIYQPEPQQDALTAAEHSAEIDSALVDASQVSQNGSPVESQDQYDTTDGELLIAEVEEPIEEFEAKEEVIESEQNAEMRQDTVMEEDTEENSTFRICEINPLDKLNSMVENFRILLSDVESAIEEADTERIRTTLLGGVEGALNLFEEMHGHVVSKEVRKIFSPPPSLISTYFICILIHFW